MDAGLCPFWRDGRCSIRPARPLGCRLYFCDPGDPALSEQLCQHAHRELAQVSASFNVTWWYGPSILYFLKNLSAMVRPEE
jgi:hypothetical protein